jgi:hypothetical protein
MAGQISITGNQTGVPSGTNTVSLTFNCSNVENSLSIYGSGTYQLLPLPASQQCNGILIVPNANNTTPLTLKGATGDTGFQLDYVQPSLISVNPIANPTVNLVIALTPLAGPITVTYL